MLLSDESVDEAETPASDGDAEATEVETEYVEVSSTSDGTTPPYMSFTGFLNFLNKIEAKGGRPPAQVDRHIFGNVSGSVVASAMSALRFFQMIDDEKRPTVVLRDLVPTDTRAVRVRELLEKHYPDELALARENGTQKQLEAILTKRGLRATTMRKAAAFLLQAMEYAGIAPSDYFTKSRPSTGSGGNRPSTGPKKSTSKKSPTIAPRTDPDTTDGESRAGLNVDEKRSAYIDLLLKLAEKEGDNEAVLARLDKILGWGGLAEEQKPQGGELMEPPPTAR